MHKLLKMQLRNIFHSKLFYVCLGITLLLSPVLSLVADVALKGVNIADEVLISEPIKAFPEMVSFMRGEVSLVTTVFIALFCCLDFNEGTAKNIIARGYSKTQYLFSKYISTTIGVLVMYLITLVVTFAFFARNGIGFESSLLFELLNNLICSLAVIIMYSTLSLVLEKNGTAIIACLFTPNIVSLVLSLLDNYLHLNVAKYWISNIPEIYLNNPTTGNFLLTTLYYGIYIVFFVLLGNYLFKSKEIK